MSPSLNKIYLFWYLKQHAPELNFPANISAENSLFHRVTSVWRVKFAIRGIDHMAILELVVAMCPNNRPYSGTVNECGVL